MNSLEECRLIVAVSILNKYPKFDGYYAYGTISNVTEIDITMLRVLEKLRAISPAVRGLFRGYFNIVGVEKHEPC